MGSKVIELLDYLGDREIEMAKQSCSEAAKEISYIESKYSAQLTFSQETVVKEVKKIIHNLKENQNRSACTAALSTNPRYHQHIVNYLFQPLTERERPANIQHSNRNNTLEQGTFSQNRAFRGNTITGNHPEASTYRQRESVQNNEPSSRTRSEGRRTNTDFANTEYHRSSYPEQTSKGLEESTKSDNSTADIYDSDKPGTRMDEEHRKNQKSKLASVAMRHNNPDIADLGDVNRPTKLAERFSELYDNEWTEAFEVLSKGELGERKSIDLLLEIVQEAYTFCEKKAGKQIAEIQSKGTRKFDGESLLQYRKSIAGEAVKQLQDEFFQILLRKCKGKLSKDPVRESKTAKYADRAVELIWWMNVQDPPVYMCPATTDGFDQSLYRAYTKSGKIPDFFVWPALRLYENGGLLVKGVVQYKG